MSERLKSLKPKQHILILFIFTIGLFYLLAFAFASSKEIFRGMSLIFNTRDVLITDYFVIAGVGGALFNAALVMTLSLCIILLLKLNLTGITIAATFIMGGFALFGKHPLNILPILMGSFIYAKVQGVKFSRFIYIALFATGLSPLVTELARILPFSPFTNLICGILAGIIAGYIIPSLAAHTISMHQGYSLFNVGFATGIIALCMVSVLRSFGLSINTTLIWMSSKSYWAVSIMYLYCLVLFIYGFFLCDWKLQPVLKIFKHPGRAIADFILMDGVGPAFMNMGLVGALCTSYILLIGGDLSGPVIGAIFTIVGFSAFGIHPFNYFPVLLGVYIAAVLCHFDATSPSLQLAAIFSAGLAPIAGQYGILPGITAGFLHASVVSYVGTVYGGMNLYNNGFAAGFVAIIMVPTIESFLRRYNNS